MKLIVRELVDLRMGRRKSHGQFCILFNHFTLSTSRGLVLAGNHYVLGGVVHLDLSVYLLRHMQNYIPTHVCKEYISSPQLIWHLCSVYGNVYIFTLSANK